MRFLESCVFIIILISVCISTAQSQNCDWTGTWNTNWGEMKLTQSGNTVTGEYTWDKGKITGTVSGQVLKGTWSESPSYSPPNDAGDFEFTKTTCDSFEGKWRYGSSGEWRTDWSGTRIITDAGSGNGETTKPAKDCSAECRQKDPHLEWADPNSNERPEGPELCTCKPEWGYGYDSDLGKCASCDSICKKSGEHLVWDGVSADCGCKCEAGWTLDGKGGCEPVTTDCNAYCSNSGAHKVWDGKSIAPNCLCNCSYGYHSEGDNCVENIKRPDKFLGSSAPLEAFLTDKLHYTQGSCADRTTAPVGSVILWGQASGELVHATLVISEYEQIGMGIIAIRDNLDKVPEPYGKPYFCQKIYNPPESARSRLLNPLIAKDVVARHENDKRQSDAANSRFGYEWDCWGFAANLAYELLGGETVLDPP